MSKESEVKPGANSQTRFDTRERAFFRMIELDAVTKYWLEELKPQTRLGYCLITHMEKALLEAMCCFSTDGAAVDRSLDVLARRAGMTRRSVQRLLNGYKNGSREIRGLKAKGVVSEQAPSKTKVGKKTKPAVLHINWEALALDPGKRHILIARMQQTLPGMKSRPVPELAENDESTTPSGKPVHSPLVGVTQCRPPLDTVSPLPVTQCRPPLDTVSPQDLGFVFGFDLDKNLDNSSSANSDRGVVQIPSAGNAKAVSKKPFSAKPKSSWSTLHPDIRAGIKRELALIAESQIGMNTFGWSPEQIAHHRADNMRLACERAGIWKHVTEDLVAEQYETAMQSTQSTTSTKSTGDA